VGRSARIVFHGTGEHDPVRPKCNALDGTHLRRCGLPPCPPDLPVFHQELPRNTASAGSPQPPSDLKIGGMRTGTTWLQTTATAPTHGPAGQAAATRPRAISCVYLTASIRAARLASRLAGFARIDVYGAAALAEAETRLVGTRSRVLLADVSFERADWQDALQMAGSLPFQVALVLVSPAADKHLWIDALERGVYDLILEPFHEDELRHILEGAHFRATSGGPCRLFVPDPPGKTPFLESPKLIRLRDGAESRCGLW